MTRRDRSKLEEIVSATGFSIATVSRALNSGKAEMVKDATKEKIYKAAGRLNYIPDRMARSLRTRRTNTFGFMINFEADTISGYMHEILNGILSGLKGTNYDMKLVSSSHHSTIDGAIKTHGLDGLILPHNYKYAFPNLAKESEQYKKKAWPVVIVNDYQPRFYTSQLYIDNFNASQCLADYLIDRGHRSFYYIGCEGSSPDADERKRGFLAAMKRRSIKFDPKKDAMDGHFSQNGGYEEALKLLRSRKNFRGVIFCANDAMALGALRAIGETGLRCPDDISVAGFDGIAAGEFSNPPLTTIKIDLEGMGKAAVTMLKDITEGRQRYFVKQKFPFKLVERKSCRMREVESC